MGKDRKKDKALDLLATGRWDKARDLLKKILADHPEDYRLWLRLGDAYRKLQDSTNAVEAYRKAARGFGAAGFLVQAIACQKQVLDLKPDEDEIHEELAALYAQRGMTYKRPARPEPEIETPAGPPAEPVPEAKAPKKKAVEEKAPEPADAAPTIEPLPDGGEPASSSIEDDSAQEMRAARVELRLPDGPAVEPPEIGLDPAVAVAEDLEDLQAEMPEIWTPPSADELPPVPLLADLDARELRTLLERLTRKAVAQGEVVFREGDEGDSLYMISRGRVGVFTGEYTDIEDLLAVLGEGEFFGEFALLTKHRRQASVVALDDCELLEVSQETYRAVIEEHPRVREVAQEYYHRRILANLQQRCALFRSLPPEERERVLGLGERRVFLEGTPILREGMRGDSLFVIADGEVEVRVNFGNGDLQLARLGPGEFFGEVSALTGNPCTADVFAVSRVEVVAFEREAAAQLAAQFPSIRRILEAFSDRRLHRTLGKLEAVLGQGPDPGAGEGSKGKDGEG